MLNRIKNYFLKNKLESHLKFRARGFVILVEQMESETFHPVLDSLVEIDSFLKYKLSVFLQDEVKLRES